MTLTLEDFIRQVKREWDCRRRDAESLYLPPNASPQDVEELISELVRQKKLTQFQADAMQRGEADSLILDNYTLLEKDRPGGMGQCVQEAVNTVG